IGGKLIRELTDAPLRPSGRSMEQDQGCFARPRRACWRHRQGQPAIRRGGALPLSCRHTMARPAGPFWRANTGSRAVVALGEARRMEEDRRNAGGRCGQRIRDDGQHHRTRTSAQRRRSKKDGEDQAIGRSKGGLSTKIHAMVDALGNPLAFFLTAGQAHDLEGADALLPQMQADTLLADKAFDAHERVIEPLLAAGKTFVIPPTSNRKVQRLYDKELYKARHLMENFYCKLRQYRAIASRHDKTARNFLAGIHLAAAVIWLN